MVDAKLFDKLNYIAQKLRKNCKPFGGIQIILAGDFFQLPPVGEEPQFIFQSKTWAQCIKKVFTLSKVYRQVDPGQSLLLPWLHLTIPQNSHPF